MKKVFLIILCLLFIAMPANAETFKIDKSRIDPNVKITKISDNIWVHTGRCKIGEDYVAANGIIALTKKGIVLIDTQWDNSQTASLLKQIKKRFNRKIELAIITHAHADKIGGIETLLKKGVKVISTPATSEAAGKNGYIKPLPELTRNVENICADGLNIETYFPGAAHSRDNIVVYFPDYKTLFAGCIIKSAIDNTLGNTADGDILQYSGTVKNIINKYPDVQTVIVSHGKEGGAELLRHTYIVAELKRIELLKNIKNDLEKKK